MNPHHLISENRRIEKWKVFLAVLMFIEELEANTKFSLGFELHHSF
jgi:hypothetical protein